MSNKKRNSLKHLWDEGLSVNEAARQVGMEAATVARMFDQFEQERNH